MQQDYWQKFWQRQISRRRMLQGVAVGGAGLAAAAVIGCGDEEEPSAQPTGTGAAAEQPRQGGTFAYTQTSEVAPTMDTHRISHTLFQGMGLAYNKLVKHDFSKYPGEIAFIGELAENWENPDPTTWVLNIHHGVKFHNIAPVNGRELKAADVVYSFQRR